MSVLRRVFERSLALYRVRSSAERYNRSVRCAPFAVLLLAGCAADVSSNKAAGAVAAVGFGVAAAGVYRATTGGCWAECRPGLRCDQASGTCVPLEPSSATRAKPAVSAASAPETLDDAACGGLCFRGERCVVHDGIADCVPDGASPPK